MCSVRHRFALRALPGVLLLVLVAALMLAAPWQAEAETRHGASSRSSTEVARHAKASESVLVLGSGYRQGGSGQVRSVQRRLVRAGFEPGPIDGLYGPLTTRAVRRFQQSQGITVDGKVGPETRRRLRSPTGTALMTPGSGYPQGGAGQVRKLQRQLARAGIEPGPIDGLYGPLTTRAVTRFQESQGLPADGVVGPRTRRQLPRAQRARARGTESTGRANARSRPAHNARSKPKPVSGNRLPRAKLPAAGTKEAGKARPPATAPPDPNESHDAGASNLFAGLFVLAMLVAALLLVWTATRPRRPSSIPRHPRSKPRPRRYVGDRAIALLKRTGFRYDYVRHAYVLRGLGARWGPVFQHWPDDAQRDMGADREPSANGAGPEEAGPRAGPDQAAVPMRPAQQPSELQERSNRFRPQPERPRQPARGRGDR